MIVLLEATLWCGALLMVAVPLDIAQAAQSEDWRYQCDSAVGPDPSATATAPSASTAAPEDVTLRTPPATNPYASLTAPPGANLSDWERACISAMPSAPYQMPALRTPNSGVAVACAGALAVEQVGVRVVVGAGGLDGPSGDAFGPPVLTRYVTYLADLATSTGQCAPAALPPATQHTACSPLLPETIAGQGVCGQRVDIAAASAGDLVFWDYQDSRPNRVGIALGAGEIVTADLSAGRFVRQQIPHDADVRVKRVLGR
ncbi:hypothetical protein HLB23_06360 [Nocardia uniformis]|uniref:Uncharacterized protein n=1 Tax=Nocardia uniformis TaxID=53432 RepID=A0A849BTN5_9NOCA|nr:hypothetical protein [Nocardia uniformis]NNH69494.1 hypothetical protein [Nocardia uniformis]